MPNKQLPKKAVVGPYKLTAAVADGYCDMVRRHIPPPACAAALGLNPQTVRNWMQRGEQGEQPYAEFVERVRQAEAESVESLVNNIASAGEDPRQWKANAYLLGLKGIVPESRSVRVNVNAELGLPDDPGSKARDVIENGSEVEDEEVAACKASILRISAAYESAQRSGSHTAVSRLGAQLDEAQAKLREAKKRAQAGTELRNVPEAEFCERLRIAAEQMPEKHLQIVANEWLRRHRLRTVPIESKGGQDDVDER